MRQLALISLAFLCIHLAQAQESASRSLVAKLGTQTPTIDGDLSDPAWKEAAKAEGFWDRLSGGRPADQTTAWILQDKDAIYVAFECQDSQPDKIMARETVRDQKYSGHDDNPNKEDNVTFMVEPFFTRKQQDQSFFSVNAIGTRSAAIAGGRSGKVEWQGDWAAAVKRTATGWNCEIRIPFGMLNFPNSAGPVKMGINFHRYQDRTKTESVWSDIGRQGLTDLAGIWTDVQVPKASFRPKISYLPYVLPGVRDGKATFRSGIDVRSTITPTLTGVAALNPDFGTIEGAVESVAFSRKERYIQEKRPFFIEGGDYFGAGTRINDIGAFFYSRRIPTFDVGTKIYGKLNPHDSIGILNTLTLGERYDGVLRYKHDLNDKDQVGFIVTNQSQRDLNNSVGSIDTRFRRGNWGFETQAGKSWGQDRDGGFGIASTTFEDGFFTGALQYQTISKEFNPSNGFIPFRGFSGPVGILVADRQWKGGKYRGFSGGVAGLYFDHPDGTAMWHGGQGEIEITDRQNIAYQFTAEYNEFEGTIDNTYRLGLTFGADNRFRQFGIKTVVGRQGGDMSTYLEPSVSLRFGKHLDMSYAGSFLNLNGVTKQQILSASYEFSPIQSIGGRLVAQDSDLNWYLSFRRSGTKGIDTYFIIGDPNARRFQQVVQLKMVVPF